MAQDKTPGYKTTEFWLSLAAVALSATLASGLLQESDTKYKVLYAIVTALTALGYTAGRAIVKSNQVKADTLRAVAVANPTQPQ